MPSFVRVQGNLNLSVLVSVFLVSSFSIGGGGGGDIRLLCKFKCVYDQLNITIQFLKMVISSFLV